MSGRGADERAADGRRVRREYDWAAVPPTAGVVETVAAATGVGERELTPLFESLDPDALDRAVRSLRSSADADGDVSFEWASCRVTVDATSVVVRAPQ